MAIQNLDRHRTSGSSCVSAPDDARPAPTSTSTSMSTLRRSAGVAVLSVAVAASIAWLVWRAIHLGPHPVQVAYFLAEVASVVTGLLVGIGLARRTTVSPTGEIDRRESFRFAYAVTDAVGAPRPTDIRRDLARYGRLTCVGRARLADVSVAAALSDGPRRLVLVVSLTLALLLGVAPMAVPPLWAVLCGVAGLVLMSSAHVLLGFGRTRFGDRVRWSSAALGEICAGTDHDGVAPRRWVGTVAAVVTLNLAVGLRGMSDRWTHGLAPMTADGRLVTMVIANAVVVGGLYTLRTTTAPQLDNAHLVPRRTEERRARQSAVGATVALSLIGLFAAALPGNIETARLDPGQLDPGGVERIPDRVALVELSSIGERASGG